MKITIPFTLLFCLSLTTISFGQERSFNIIELSYDLGLSNDLAPLGTYNSFRTSQQIEVEKRSFAIVRNVAFSYSRYFTEEHGLEILVGYAKYGFDYENKPNSSTSLTGDSYRTSYLEWGLSYVHRIPILNLSSLLIKPGLRYHSDASSFSRTIYFINKNSFSLSTYVGYEFPTSAKNIFVNFGLQAKIPLERYNFDFNGNSGFFPFFFGLKVALSGQF